MQIKETVKKYNTYKDSGIEWIGEIPQDWDIKKIKYCCNVYTGNSISDDEKDNFTFEENAIPYIATKDIDADTNVINYENGLYIPLDNENFKVAPSNSSLLCVEGGSAGKKIGFTNQDVCFVNKLCCFNVKDDFNSKFLYYALQSDEFLTDFNLKMTGLIGGVSQNAIKNISIATPKIDEQQKIADYLDKKCGEIDRVVETEKSVIEKLKEYKQSIITEAVTKGLDKSAPLKDSGIEWIGEIPQYWEVRKLKTIGDYRNGLTYSPEDMCEEEQGTLVLRSSNIRQGKLVLNDNVYVSVDIPNVLKVQKGDILVCSRNGSRDLIGKNAIIDSDINASFGAFMMILRCNCPKYMYYILNSHIFNYYLGSFFTSTINQLTGKNFGGMDIVFCPDTSEQNAIIEYLDKKCSEIDKAIADKEQVIEKFTEYKKSLIYECVTGKRKVV